MYINAVTDKTRRDLVKFCLWSKIRDWLFVLHIYNAVALTGILQAVEFKIFPYPSKLFYASF